MSYRGEKIVEFDIKSSQPFILTVVLTLLLENHKYVTELEDKRQDRLHKTLSKRIKKDLKRLLNKEEVYEYKVEIDRRIDDISTIMIKKATSLYFVEIHDFISDIRNGDIYEKTAEELLKQNLIIQQGNVFLMKRYVEELGYQTVVPFNSLRECGKKIVLSSIYSSVKPTLNLVIAFRELYPSTMILLDVFKKEDHTHLALVMQRIESRAILDVCARKASRRLPMTPLITRHDSISTTESCASELGVLFKESLVAFFKTDVVVKRSSW